MVGHARTVVQAREANQPADVDDWYNLFWFDPTNTLADGSIANRQNAASSAITEAQLLTPLQIQALNDQYSSVEAGIIVSIDPVVQALAVSANARINRSENSASTGCVDIENGVITSYSCPGDLRFIYEVPTGGMLLVNVLNINFGDMQTNTFDPGNTDTEDAEMGYGVQWWVEIRLDTDLLNTVINTNINNPTLQRSFANTAGTVSAVTSQLVDDTDLFNAAAFMMRGIRTGEY